MAWTARKPDIVTDLADAARHCRSAVGGRLVSSYVAFMAEAGGAVPAKNGLDLSRLAKALPDLMLAAVTKPDRWICRLAGERVRQRLGRSPVGGNYYDIVPPERRANAMHAMNMVIDVPCGFRAEIEQMHRDGVIRLSEAVALPLSSEEPGVDGFILFADSHIEDVGSADPDPGGRFITGANVTRRDLIDLGFGVDETFEDLVPE
ncbi:MAG: hypothetical protein RIM84_16300 [Alphaproteobacteria bacterium]